MAAAESTAPELTWYDPDGGRHSVVLEPSRSQLTIGRRPESEVALPWDTEVSRAHARLERVGRDWTIRDDGLSRNGTWLNGRRLHGSRRLVHGDIIRVGRTMLTVMARRDGESLPTAGADRDALQTASAPAGVRVHLCGPLILERGGERLDSTLPGRQGRLLFAYLVAHRSRPVRRDELIDVVWGSRPPKDPQLNLNVLLARLRKALGEDAITGRGAVTIDLGPEPFVDVEAAEGWAADAQRALSAHAPAGAVDAARAALEVLRRPLLPELDHAWVIERRRELDELAATTLETLARAALAVGEGELTTAEAAARELVQREPYRESGYALLMEVLAAAGNQAESLLVFDRLRSRLREDLGVAPSAPTVALLDRLLRGAPAG